MLTYNNIEFIIIAFSHVNIEAEIVNKILNLNMKPHSFVPREKIIKLEPHTKI